MAFVPPKSERKASRQRRILREIQIERRRQDRQWGGDKHDDRHAARDFCDFIQKQIRYMQGLGTDNQPRERFVKIAALAMAAAEMLDREVAQ